MPPTDGRPADSVAAPPATGFVALARWELTRRVAPTLGTRLIILDRAVKVVVLSVGGIALLVASQTGALASLTERIQTELNVEPGRHLWLHLTQFALQRLNALGNGAEVAIAVAAFFYAALEAIEAVGLLLRRRWAEYLVLLATGAFLPLEIVELSARATVFKALALMVNLAIVVYLVWRKRLFIDRPTA